LHVQECSTALDPARYKLTAGLVLGLIWLVITSQQLVHDV